MVNQHAQNILEINMISNTFIRRTCKKICQRNFNEKLKNRKLIQEFALKVKEIDNDVWVNYLLNDINIDDNIVIDDLRFSRI